MKVRRKGIRSPYKLKTHGMSDTPEYRAYIKMKHRCYTVSCSHFSDYGGRGIFVCDEWKDSFVKFYEDMGPRPSGSHSLDRINNNEGYSPNNCRWATTKQQSDNKRSSLVFTVNGVTDSLTNLCVLFNLDRRTVDARLKRGVPIENSFHSRHMGTGRPKAKKTHVNKIKKEVA